MTDRHSLKERLYRYLVKQGRFVAKGDLQRLVAEHTKFTPENAGRRLRELHEEGLLEVDYRKGHAHYRARPKAPSPEEWFDSLPASNSSQ